MRSPCRVVTLLWCDPCDPRLSCLAVQPLQLDVPKAPGLGLLLDEPFFKNYNNKYRNDKEHSTLEWDDIDPAIEAFKLESVVCVGGCPSPPSSLVPRPPTSRRML